MTYMMKPLSYVLVIVLGYLLKRAGFFSAQDRRMLSKIMLNITLPCAIIQAFDGLKPDGSMLLIAGLGLACAGLPIILMYLTSRGRDTALAGFTNSASIAVSLVCMLGLSMMFMG